MISGCTKINPAKFFLYVIKDIITHMAACESGAGQAH